MNDLDTKLKTLNETMKLLAHQLNQVDNYADSVHYRKCMHRIIDQIISLTDEIEVTGIES